MTFCQGFHPIVVLEGQLCYTLNIADKVRGKSNTKINRVGVLLALDPGIVPNSLVSNGSPLFKLYVHTLSYFTDHRAGNEELEIHERDKKLQSYAREPEEMPG